MRRAIIILACSFIALSIAAVPRRSPQWPAARKAHLAVEPYCRACGGTDSLEVHHNLPYNLAPELELAETNLVTLCRPRGKGCHWWVGHGGKGWKTGPDVQEIYGGVSNSTGRKVWEWRGK